MFRKLFLLMSALALVLWAVGCSNNPSEPTQTTDISAQFGGYTTSNEAPGFGDPTLTAEASAEVSFDDPMANLPVIDSLLRDPNAGIYHLRVLWGHLRFDSTETDWTTWDGSLTLSRGAEVLRRVIKFEDNDSILPRTDRRVISWVSRKRPHFDGLAVDLFVPPQRPVLDSNVTITIDSLGDTIRVVVYDTLFPLPVTLTFETGPYSRTFALPELVKLDTIVELADSNQVAFYANRLDRIPCPRGFLVGTWGFDSTGQGMFRGIWMSRNGWIDGTFDGKFGLNDSGKKVFYGKWINNDGQFEGLMRGYWGEHPNYHADTIAMLRAGGWFHGGLFDGNASLIGVVRGHYMSSEVGRLGFMMGRWKIGCPDFDADNHPDGMGDDAGDQYRDRPEDFGGMLHRPGGTPGGNGGGHGGM